MTVAPPDIEHDAIAIESGPGQRLHDARRAASLSVADVAAQLHLDATTIEALERDDYAKLPAPAFVRGYLRSYARLVNLAPEPVVAAYSSRGFEPPALVADISSGSQGQSESTDLPWRLMTYLIAGVVVTLVVMWWRSNMGDPFSVIDDVIGIGEPVSAERTPAADTSLAYQVPAAPATAPATAAAPAGDAPAAPATGTVSGAAAPASPPTFQSAPAFQSVVVASGSQPGKAAGADGPAPAAEAVPAASGQGTVQPPQPTVTASASTQTTSSPEVPAAATTAPSGSAPAPAAGTPEPTAPASAAAPGELRLAFTHDSWLEVYDARGERLFFGMARAGRDMNLRGTPPLRVLLGYARDIRVEYNGRLLDYAAFVNRGIARFIVTADGIRGEPG